MCGVELYMGELYYDRPYGLAYGLFDGFAQALEYGRKPDEITTTR